MLQSLASSGRPWPRPRAGALALARILLGAAAIAAAARLAVPLPHGVPICMQPLAVFLLAVALGAHEGAAAVLVYLGEGALGLPVFAGGAAGAVHLVGPTAGYLWAYVPLAGWTGAAAARARQRRQPPWRTVAAVLAAQAALLASGAAWLSVGAGPRLAWQAGVVPFVGLALVNAAIVSGAACLAPRRG